MDFIRTLLQHLAVTLGPWRWSDVVDTGSKWLMLAFLASCLSTAKSCLQLLDTSSREEHNKSEDIYVPSGQSYRVYFSRQPESVAGYNMQGAQLGPVESRLELTVPASYTWDADFISRGLFG